MTDEIYRRLRRHALTRGDIDANLLALLRQVVDRVIQFRGFPPQYSPTGQWDADAGDEILADWLETRLIRRGQLAAILHAAATAGSFMRVGEEDLRRHLINRLERSQAANLYGRVRGLLEADGAPYVVMHPAARPQDTAWGPASEPVRRPWTGSDDDLVAHAWSLGAFDTIPYRDDARKLSPLLGRDELKRFVDGMMTATRCALTPSDLCRALVRRFNLEPADIEPVGEEAEQIPSPVLVIDQAVDGELARAALFELRDRQVEVLREWLSNQTVRDIAKELRVSVGTVSAEQQAISAVLSRLADPDGDGQARLLNALRDALFLEN